MEKAFWQARWDENRIGFHEAQVNALLGAHFDSLYLVPGDHIFVPLCGKSFDLDWLLARGLHVTGIEFHQPAVQEVFDRLDLEPEVTQTGPLTRFQAGPLTLFCGDIFALTQAELGPVQAVYDRAALIALPAKDRARYAQHLVQITRAAPQLLICLNYDQSKSDGPPFSVSKPELETIYGAHYSIDALAAHPLTGPISKRSAGTEEVWHLR